MAAVPVLKMGHLALVSIQVDMDDQLALGLQEDLSERILEWRATGVIIDISSLVIVDSASISSMTSNALPSNS